MSIIIADAVFTCRRAASAAPTGRHRATSAAGIAANIGVTVASGAIVVNGVTVAIVASGANTAATAIIAITASGKTIAPPETAGPFFMIDDQNTRQP